MSHRTDECETSGNRRDIVMDQGASERLAKRLAPSMAQPQLSRAAVEKEPTKQ